jgi:gamma-glutamyltranspeptidase/glutathione hydrolase
MAASWSPTRPPAVAARALVSTSQPLATTAGLRMLESGGNAVDAALAAAAVLCVTEPMSTGPGGDLFAIVSQNGAITALDAAGPAPAAVDRPLPVAPSGARSIDVPGAVAGWAELSQRHGRRGLDHCLASAIDVAERGYAVGEHSARMWSEADPLPPELAPAPARGTTVRLPDLAATLRAIADHGPSAFYEGSVGEAIVAASWLAPEDLTSYAPQWVEPLRLNYCGTEVLEMPAPTQGVFALEGLGLLQELGPGLGHQIQATRLALEDAHAHVRDGADVSWLLSPDHLRRRSKEAAASLPNVTGGTVYLCVVDEDGMAVSLIQSVFAHFGAGVVAPGTGVVLNNRAACFEVGGQGVIAGRRPFHTIIPGMLLRDGALLGPFGIMGGFIQAQAHVQFVASVVDDGLDPQAALDRPRFRLEGDEVALEAGLWDQADAVRSLGLTPVRESEVSPFGGGQAIFVADDHLVGGTDARKDGYAAGY